jgi:hypothetical protein
MHRVTAISLTILLAIATALGVSLRAVAGPVASTGHAAATCCGGDCRCGDDCACAVEEAPTAPGDEQPALPERTRGERLPTVAAPAAAITAVTLSEPMDLGAPARASSRFPAPPSCRLRLALVSRWTT